MLTPKLQQNIFFKQCKSAFYHNCKIKALFGKKEQVSVKWGVTSGEWLVGKLLVTSGKWLVGNGSL